MKNYRIFIIAAAALVLGACQEKESLAPRNQAIRFTTNLGAYTKATDTNFEEGDAVSLFAEEPINALNVKMVCSGGELVPETPVFWKEDQPANQYTNFFAVYPYRDDWEDLSDLSVFSVNADQRTHAQYTASDLLGASYMAYPDCETVPLNFTHRLCRLNVEVYTYGSDLSVADVYLKETYGKVRLGLYHRMEVYTVGEKGTIRMGKSYDNTWSAIVPPQAFDFPVVVVMSDGTMYEFAAESWSQVYMESAKSYTAHIEIDDRTTTISGSIAVENWTADNDAAFGNYIADEYHTEGWWSIKEAGTENYQELIYNTFNDVHFEAGLSAATGKKYELVYQNGRRELIFGLENAATASVGGEYILKENGSAFGFSAAGEYVVKVFPYSGHVVIDADNEVWSVIGDFGDNPWNTDLDMVRESSGIYSIDFESYGQEFKLRANHNWEKNLGYQYQLWTGNSYWLNYGGNNITLGEAGKYHLELDSRSCKLSVTLLESYASEGAFGQILGSWQCMDTNGNNYSVAIYDNGYPNCTVRLYDFDIAATYDLSKGKVKVCFQRLGEWNWNNYGLVYDYFLAHSGDQNFFLEEDGSKVLFYLEKTADGNILVSPGSYGGVVFDSFEFIVLLQEGDYAGAYARYGDIFPLPMTWTPAN